MTDLAPLLKALNAVMAKVGYVQKGSRNAFHNYSYASEGELLEALRPAMVENGLILLPSMDTPPTIDEYGNTHLVMAYTLAHTSGAVWPEKLLIPGCGNDKNKSGIGDKGTYKALTGANKYLLFKLFQIATGDDPEVPNAMETSKEPTSLVGKTVNDLIADALYCDTTDTLDALMRRNHITIKAWEANHKKDFARFKEAVTKKRAELTPKDATPAPTTNGDKS